MKTAVNLQIIRIFREIRHHLGLGDQYYLFKDLSDVGCCSRCHRYKEDTFHINLSIMELQFNWRKKTCIYRIYGIQDRMHLWRKVFTLTVCCSPLHSFLKFLNTIFLVIIV